jgi:hypothetical protein
MGEPVYCRNCGAQLRGLLGHWWHTQRLGPVPCPGAEPETGPETEPVTKPEDRRRDP